MRPDVIVRMLTRLFHQFLGVAGKAFMGQDIFIPIFRAHSNAASGGQGLARRVKRTGFFKETSQVQSVTWYLPEKTHMPRI
jgi:hypothetical protein